MGLVTITDAGEAIAGEWEDPLLGNSRDAGIMRVSLQFSREVLFARAGYRAARNVDFPLDPAALDAPARTALREGDRARRGSHGLVAEHGRSRKQRGGKAASLTPHP